jgi:predicted dehydrogenase
MLKRDDLDAIYIAVPNHLHYAMCKQALLAGHSVILEKPMTSNDTEVDELAGIARDRGLYLFEAISTIYFSNYNKIIEWLPRIGDVKIVSCNYSQYSSRYDAFRNGEILPVFDPAKSGGALMDLNVYNLHYVMGIFGKPDAVSYDANVERGIDTSGVIRLDYGSFKAVLIAAKDCAAPAGCVIQGTKGYIIQNTPANACGAVTLHLNDGTVEHYDEAPGYRLEPEFRFFADTIKNKDLALCYEKLSHSIDVCRVMAAARRDAGVIFAADGL